MGVNRREFLATATGGGVAGLAGCTGFGDGDNDETPTPGGGGDPVVGDGAANRHTLAGRARTPSGEPLAGATVRLLAKPEDSYTAGTGTSAHEELARATTDADGTFRFAEVPASRFESLREEHDSVLFALLHPDGWFSAGTLTGEAVFASDGVLSEIRSRAKYVLPPTLVGGGDVTRRGVVSAWRLFDADTPERQQAGIEVTATNPRAEREVYDIENWVDPNANVTHRSVLEKGMFTLDVPESGVDVDYDDVRIERAKPTEALSSARTGTESPIDAIEKWHPLRPVDGQRLDLPARAMVAGLYDEFTESDQERARLKRGVGEFVLGATPVVGNAMALASLGGLVSDLLDGGDAGIDRSPGVGDALGDDVDRSERDVIGNGIDLDVVSAVAMVPYRVTDGGDHSLTLGGTWSTRGGGTGRARQRFPELPADVTDASDTTDGRLRPEEGLRGYWPLDAVRDGDVADASDFEHRGTVHGDPTVVDGVVGRALSFDGRDDAVVVEMTDDLRVTGSFTVELWIRVPPNPPENRRPIGMHTYKGDVSAERFVRLQSDGSRQRLNFHVRHSSGVGRPGRGVRNDPYYHIPNSRADNRPAITPNEWHHVALWYDGTRQRIGFHFDGVEATSYDAPHEPRVDDTHLTIGASAAVAERSRGAPAKAHFRGAVDEVALYATALPESVISRHANRGDAD